MIKRLFLLLTLLAVAYWALIQGGGNGMEKVQRSLALSSDSQGGSSSKGRMDINPKDDATASIALPETKLKELKALVLDHNQSAEERLSAWERLDQNLPHSASELFEIAVSKNPYSHSTHKHEEHGIKEFQFRREESVRVLALQSLEKSISSHSLDLNWIANAAKTAESPAVRSIARKIVEFAQKGLSYSEMFERAASQLKIPK